MIDLADYTPTIMKFIKQRKLCAVCIFAHEGKPPSKITYAFDPLVRWNALQAGNPKRITVEYLLWTPGAPVAQILVQSTKQAFENRKIIADWCLVQPHTVAFYVDQVAHRLFPSAQIVDHVGMMRLLKPSRVEGVVGPQPLPS